MNVSMKAIGARHHARITVRNLSRVWKRTRREVRAIDPRARPLPTFLIIGAQKGGTSSLFAHLAQHPLVIPPVGKEVHYFDVDYDRGARWYRAAFPRSTRSDARMAGEATPYYLYHPCVPQRAHDLLPAAKLIVLLRDPVTRAFSHYQHAVRLGLEHGRFEDAIADESSRMRREEELLLTRRGYKSAEHQHRSYVSRGLYLEQLLRWTRYYSREQLLVLRSEEMFTNPAAVYNRTLEFLGLPEYVPPHFAVRNSHPHQSALAQSTREHLEAYYAEPNARLEEWLGYDMRWSAPRVDRLQPLTTAEPHIRKFS